MNRFILVVLFVFASGCNGEEFTTFAAPLDATGLETGTGGAPTASGGQIATGGAPKADAGTGGLFHGTGGSSHGAGGSFQTGGAPTTGGVPATGGTPNIGGAPVDACSLMTHDNGLGQTWQDCVPLGTYNEEQAMKACEASGAAICVKSERCGPSVYEVQGFNADRSQLIGEWGYGNFAEGFVSPDYNLCGAGNPNLRRWN